jgi:hypothetical protein
MGQQIKEDMPIFIVLVNFLSGVATAGDMIQRPRKGNPRESSHACIFLEVRVERRAEDLSNVRPAHIEEG